MILFHSTILLNSNSDGMVWIKNQSYFIIIFFFLVEEKIEFSHVKDGSFSGNICGDEENMTIEEAKRLCFRNLNCIGFSKTKNNKIKFWKNGSKLMKKIGNEVWIRPDSQVFFCFFFYSFQS